MYLARTFSLCGFNRGLRTMNMPKRYPPDLRKLVEPRLRRLLASYVDHGHVPRCLIAFAGVGEIDFTLRLITDPDWKIMHAGMEDGLVGFAFREPGIYRWSAGDRNTAFREGDHRTRHEVSASLCLDGAAVAVLLIDFFDGEIVPKGLPWKTRKWQREIEQVLASADQEKGVIAADILLATENCVAETRSRRGFTALVRWDGTIKYFIAGDGKEKFKYLSQLEGICGEVIRSGQLLNIGYVWDHRSYRSSDDRVQSEAVMPITVDGEVVGVLNMESYVRDNYLSQDVEFMAAVAEELADLAQRYLGQGGGEIGIHSRLLSDLVEK